MMNWFPATTEQVFLTTARTSLELRIWQVFRVLRFLRSEVNGLARIVLRVWERWESGTAGDDVDLQAVGAGPQQVDQEAVHQRVQ